MSELSSKENKIVYFRFPFLIAILLTLRVGNPRLSSTRDVLTQATVVESLVQMIQ